MPVENQTVDKSNPTRKSNTVQRFFTGAHTFVYRLWPLLVAMYADYAGYQKKTTREIPVVILHP